MCQFHTTGLLNSPCAIWTLADRTTSPYDAFEDMDDSSHFALTSFHWIIYCQNKVFFQYSHIFLCPLRLLVPLGKVFMSPSFPDHVDICFDRCDDLLRSWYCSVDGMKDTLAFSRPTKNWLGVSAVKSSRSSLTALKRNEYNKTHRCIHYVIFEAPVFKIEIMTFVRLWGSLSKISPKCGATEVWIYRRSLFVLSHFPSYLCSIPPGMPSVPWMLRRSFYRCCWWWYLGSLDEHWSL